MQVLIQVNKNIDVGIDHDVLAFHARREHCTLYTGITTQKEADALIEYIERLKIHLK